MQPLGNFDGSLTNNFLLRILHSVISNMDNQAVDIIHNILQDGNLDNAASSALPEGKLFHLFLSHSSSDRVKVDRLREVLEAAPYNLRCCYDERDFEPGDGILQNIQLAIEKSACTCFFLSPNFVQSMWCKYEQELAHLLSLEGKSKVIPILLDQCTMPNALKFINYVDASLDEDIVAQKIVKAVKTGAKEYQPIGFPVIEKGLQKVRELYEQNGCHITLPFDVTSQKYFMTDTVKVRLTDMGLEERNFDKMESYLSIINELVRSRHGFFFSCKGLLCYILLCIPLSLSLLMIFFRLFYSKDLTTFSGYLTMSGIFLVLVWIIMCLLYIPMCKLILLKYDGTECMTYLRNILAEIDETSCAEQLDRILEHAVPSYAINLANGHLEQSSQIRHRVQNHKICLCQYAEEHYQKLLTVTEQAGAEENISMRTVRRRRMRDDRERLCEDNQLV